MSSTQPTLNTQKSTETARRKPPPQAAPQGTVAEQAPLELQHALEDPAAARPGAIIALQRKYGNRAVNRLIQTKLQVGPAGDQYEQEADQVADQVMTMPASPAPASQPGVQRQDEETAPEVQTKPLVNTITPLVQRQEDEEEIQTKPLDPRAGFEAGGGVEQQLKAEKGHGSPLPDQTRSFMEPRFGADFSGVRVHADGQAAQINRELSAQAFTHGQDIYLGAGKYSPGTEGGQRLLAHELTHVVQQGGARVAQRSGAWPLSRSQPATLRRMVLTTDQVIAGLRQVTTIQDLLNGNVSLLNELTETSLTTTAHTEDSYQTAERQETHLAQGRLRQGQTLRQHIELALQNYEAQFERRAPASTANAMKLVAALRTIGRVLASKLNAPYAQSQIATELLTVLGPQLRSKLKGGEGGEEALAESTFALAGILTSDDPVGQYMQEKISLDSAAGKIVAMATPATTPLDVFKLLSQQYQIEMGAYTAQEVHEGERAKLSFAGGEFDVAEGYGEISERYFKSVLQLDQGGQAKWQKGGKGLAFTPAKAKALKDLEAEVKQRAGRHGPTPTTLTATQQYLADLDQREAGELGAARAKLRKVYGAQAMEEAQGINKAGVFFTQNKIADAKINAALNHFANASWIIAFKPEDLFADSTHIPTSYSHFFDVATEQKALAGVLPGSTASVERTRPNALDRGPDYGTWRLEKDRRASGNAPLTARELPKYGSIQIAASPQDFITIDVYGKYHFILRKASFAGRVVFSYGTGRERKNPLLLLGDMAGALPGQNALRDLANGILRGTQVEFHVFGGIQFNAADLEQIAFPRGVRSDDVAGTVALTPGERDKITKEVKQAHPTETRPEELDRLANEIVQQKKGARGTAAVNLVTAAGTWGVPISYG